MSDTKKVTYLVNQDGETVKVPAENAQALVDAGYVGASDKQVGDARLQEKYGSAGSQLGTGVEAAAEALTLGTSDLAEQALGISSAKDIAGREAANPGAHAVGTGVGIVAPAVATLGGSAAVEGAEAGAQGVKGLAELSAPSLIGKAGEAAKSAGEGLAQKVLMGGAEGPLTRGAALAAKTVGGVAQGVTEGGLYGAGQVVHEAALGDPNFSAQSAISEIGLSALLGGGAGGVLSGAGGALGELTGNLGATKVGEKLSGWLEDFQNEHTLKAAGASKVDLKRLGRTMSDEDIGKLSQDARKLGLVDTFTTPASALEKSQDLMQSSGQKMGDLLDTADASGKAPKDIEGIVSRAKDEVLKDLESNPLEKGTANSVRDALDAYETQFASGQEMEKLGPGVFRRSDTQVGFRDLHGIRKQLDAKIYGLNGVMDPNATALKSSLSDFRSIISDEINKGMEQAGLDSAAWKTANREYRVGATINRIAENANAGVRGNNFVPLTAHIAGGAGLAAMGPLGGIAATGLTMAAKRYGDGLAARAAGGLRNLLDSGAAEEVAGKTSDAIASARQAGQDSLSSASTRQPETIAALAALQKSNNSVSAKLDSAAWTLIHGGALAEHVAGVAGHAAADSFESRSERVQQLMATPEGGISHLSKVADAMSEHAPQTAQALQVSMAGMMGALSQSMPKPQQLGPMGPTLEPSKTQKQDWMQSGDVLNNPMLAVALAHKGKLTPKLAALLATHYPALQQKLAQSVFKEALGAGGKKVPYQRKMQLSMLIGVPLDGTFSGKAILANQTSHMMPSQKSGEDVAAPRAGKSTQSGLSKLKIGSSWATPSQALSGRIRSGE